MAETSVPLPPSLGLDVGALSRLFDDATTSYKHLFFAALVTEFEESGFKARVFPISSLVVGMLAEAWYPLRYFRLSLGSRDQVDNILQDVKLNADGPIPARRLRGAISASNPDTGELKRFVPYRLIAPFFANQLRGIPDHQRNGRIRSLSVEHFHTLRPLYRFDGESVEVHPEWAEYLFKNHTIVSGWAERRWISYLQSRNLMVPAVSEKTRPPMRRGNLAVQIEYWKKVIEASAKPPRCIYSGDEIATRFDLDHFLPWTFVCHDALWNLIPATPASNMAKGNKLPDRSFLPMLAATQHAGLATARRIMSDDDWDTASMSFVDDLKIPRERVLDAGALFEAYDRLVGAQMDVASATGFEPGWRYKMSVT